MNIGLLDVDSHNFPNLALMKISAHHKSVGDSVEWLNHFSEYDKVYVSKIFTFSNDNDTIIRSSDVIYGGTGYDLQNVLPPEIESIYPDYSIYPTYKYAVGFLTRGCSRGCPFCIVNEKEGGSHKVANLSDFWSGQKVIKLLDPNILECHDRMDLLHQLAESHAEIDFTQGLDIRIMNDEITSLLDKMRIKRIHFAYDQMKDQASIERGLRIFAQKTNHRKDKISVFVLTNFNTSHEEDMYRINLIQSLGFDPFVMVYDKKNLPSKHPTLRLARWCNKPMIRKTCKFEYYK